MKQFKIMIFLLVAQVGFSQQMPIDFTPSSDNFTTFGGTTFSRVNDPIQPTNKVGQFVNDGVAVWQGAFIDLASPLNLDAGKTITLRFYASNASAHNIILKLENGVNPNVEVLKNTSVAGWTTVSFNFAQATYTSNGNAVNASGNYSRLTIFIDGGLTVAGTYLIDDISNGVVNSGLDVVYNDLVWSDEFNSNGAFSNSNWFAETQPPDNGNWFNGELQHYTNRPVNVSVIDGSLKITAKKEIYTAYGVTKNYTSARLNSLFSFKYGRVDVRAKLASGNGTWPAIWMLGTSHGNSYTPTTLAWPLCGEIDIMEHWGNNPNVIHGTIHNGASSGSSVNTATVEAESVSSTYHIYSVNWSANQISFMVDGEVFYTYNPAVKDANTWPFDAPQYILLNVAMGGTGGAIDASFVSSAMDVDYVHVYQNLPLKTENPEVAATSIFPNPALDFVTVQVEPQNIGASAQLYAVDGKKLSSFILTDTATKLDLSQYQSGIYILRIEGQNTQYQHRLIKR